ncbi:DUF4184 family protein [Microbacterium trichothecenolyticum]|uniref:Cell wall anchor protein n=1 Tax=Microbacterium trichothecenolyticum TaxID=69370 RepID=A0ABU0TSL9_MICTR|nr:DUF4184 family protein [Microbacterium trichothecenolyticum]MDQ1122662.1 hypothetical protein [Microbacterium trichothecenolyticum]
MPFTVSHAVVALPFVRTPLVPAAIAIGAMTPDLPLFLRGIVPPYAMTHDLVWLPVTVVMAFVLLLVWRCVLRPATRELVPRRIADRLPDEWDAGALAAARETLSGGVVGILWLVLSLALGVVTHVGWDFFTHEGRAGDALFPALEEQWGPLAGVKWLQYGSGVLGLAGLGAFGLWWLSRRSAIAVRRVLPDAVRVAWWLSLPIVLVAASLVAVTIAGGFDADYTPTHLIYGVLVRVAAAWGVATLVLAVVVQLRHTLSDSHRVG